MENVLYCGNVLKSILGSLAVNVLKPKTFSLAGFDNKKLINRSIYIKFKATKTDALKFLSAFMLGMFTNPMFGFFKAAFSFITKNIYYLNHEERCLYLCIVEYAEKNKTNAFSVSELRNTYFSSICDNICPYASLFECNNKNRESKELCGYYNHSFPLERVIFDLVKLNAIEYDSETRIIRFDSF